MLNDMLTSWNNQYECYYEAQRVAAHRVFTITPWIGSMFCLYASLEGGSLGFGTELKLIVTFCFLDPSYPKTAFCMWSYAPDSCLTRTTLKAGRAYWPPTSTTEVLKCAPLRSVCVHNKYHQQSTVHKLVWPTSVNIYCVICLFVYNSSSNPLMQIQRIKV